MGDDAIRQLVAMNTPCGENRIHPIEKPVVVMPFV
jgi:hypothetical protein